MTTVKELESTWKRRMTDFEDRLKTMTTPGNPAITQLADEFAAFKVLVSDMLESLRQQVSESTMIIDSLDMRQRRKILLIRGIPENTEFIVHQEVLKVIHNRLGLPDISGSDIKRCHRLGPKRLNMDRAVLVHFRDYHVKSVVWRARYKFKGTSFILTEFLTQIRQAVHTKARKHFGMKNVWSLNGTIFVRVPGGGREHVRTEEEIDALVAKYSHPGCPAETAAASEKSYGVMDNGPVQNSRLSLQTTQQLYDAKCKLPISGITEIDRKRTKRHFANK